MRPNPLFRKVNGMATRMLVVGDRLQDADGFAPGALLRFYENETTTPLTVYSDEDLTVEFSQPIECDAYGAAPPIYYDGTEPYRVLATGVEDDGTETGPLPGFPRDNMAGLPGGVTAADSIPFEPTEDLPFTTVQAAIVGAGALSSDQTDLFNRALTPWTTGGTGDAYTVTPTPAVTGYGTFLPLRVRFDRVNTGAATLNVNALGARNIYQVTRTGTVSALGAGAIQPGSVYDLTYDGTQFVIMEKLPGVQTGSYRFPFGLQICMGRATFTFASSTALSATLTFPDQFAATPIVTLSPPNTTLGTYTGVLQSDLGITDQGSGTASVVARILMDHGHTIASGASITNVGWTAMGTWF